MVQDLAALPNDLEELKRIILGLRNENILLREEVLLLKHLRYAAKSEKWTAEDHLQKLLFNEAESVPPETDGEGHDDARLIEVGYTRKKAGRRPLPENLPRHEIIHDLPEAEKLCPCCGKRRPLVGRSESEELQFIPAKIQVNRHIRLKYGPCTCDAFQADESRKQILLAPAPPRLLPGSIASSGLLSYLLVGKYCDALPFYRQERIFSRLGIDLSRTNMANWTIAAASRCSDLIDVMWEKTREGPLINMDETTVQVLDEPGRKAESKSFIWVTVGTDRGRRIVLFNYSRTRREEVPVSLLEGFRGVLQTDGYSGYQKAVSQYRLPHVGCFAHVRRKFFEALKASKSGGQAKEALEFIRRIYAVEKDLRKKNLNDRAFLHARRAQVVPILRAFSVWLKKAEQTVLPRSKLGEAVCYMLGEYRQLVRYLKYAEVTPDNNIAENCIRPFVIGRKNWLFSATPRGAHASAVMYSLIETAKVNGSEPQEYLYRLFESLPRVTSRDELESLLPWNIKG